jgi:hypothetical protein
MDSCRGAGSGSGGMRSCVGLARLGTEVARGEVEWSGVEWSRGGARRRWLVCVQRACRVRARGHVARQGQGAGAHVRVAFARARGQR